MHRYLIAAVGLLLVSFSACSAQPAPTVTVTAQAPTPSESSTIPTPSPTPSPTSTGPVPTTLTNGWEQEPRIQDSVDDVLASLNEVYPSADLEGAAYVSPDDPDITKGVLFLMVGQTPLDDRVLGLLAEGGEPEQLREFTRCASVGEGEDRKMGCTTDTYPSVTIRYTDAEEPAYNLAELAELTAAYQATL